MLSIESFYKEYPCSHNSPLNCDKPLETVQEVQGAKFCFECGFPACLPEEAEIKGYRGSYRVTKFLGIRGFGRLYSGTQIKDGQPVLIKEYLLPTRSFNQDETFKRKESFRRIGGVELADGRVQNFRLIQTWEAIAPEQGERCYLITKDTQPSQTLRQYLKQYGRMSPEQVREFLDEVLQTLVFMHSQKLRFPSNQVQRGLQHGNINLDSVLIKVENKQRFVAYLCDVAIWENLFVPPSIPQPTATTTVQDLEALALVALQLWVGKSQSIDPKDDKVWPDNDIHLKRYLYRLLSLDTNYGSAEIARTELLKLPQPDESNTKPSSDEEEQKRFPKKYLLGLGLLLLLLLAGALWYYLWLRNKQGEAQYSAWRDLTRNFSAVNNVGSGKFNYVGESDGTWTYVLGRNPENTNITLNNELTEPKQTTTFNYQGIVSKDIKAGSEPVQILLRQDAQKNFAITSLSENIKLDIMDKKPVAYDGLLVFVAFHQGSNLSLHTGLQGKISIKQLRDIYVGKFTKWNQLDKNYPDLAIQPLVPTEPEAIQQFKKLVLNNDQQDVATFEEKIVKLSTQKTGATQLQMSEANRKGEATGIISFGILSKTWDQCAGYPLAIVDSNNQEIQALSLIIQQRPIQPSDNLCEEKGNLYFDVKNFQEGGTEKYPLSYPLYVVYPKEDTRQTGGVIFANMLKTRQGQCLLYKVGLVPLQPVPNDIKNDACKSVP